MFKQLFELALAHAEPQRWPTYDGLELDRTEFLTSSESAGCLRRSYFGKHQEKFPTKGGAYKTNGFAERGHAIEAWLVKVLKPLLKMGYKIEYMGEDQRSFYDADLGISGTPDGLLTFPDGRKYMLEIKSIDPRANKSKLPKKAHIYQTQQNMFLMEQCLKIKLTGAFLVYIDASDVFDIREYPMVYDKSIVDESIARADELWRANSPDDLEPEGIYNDDCEYCSFTQHCSQVVNMQKTLEKLQNTPTPFLSGETESLPIEDKLKVEQWIDAWEGEKQYASQKEEVDGEVRQLVVRYNGYVQVDNVGLIGVTLPGRETIDKKLMEADGLDVKKYLKTGAPYVKITVKEGQPT